MCDKCKNKPDNSIGFIPDKENNITIWVTPSNEKEYLALGGYNVGTPCNKRPRPRVSALGF